MKAIIKRELKNYLKNPIFWIGILIVIVQMYQILNPYLKIHYFESDKEIQDMASPEAGDNGDGDIMKGYIPSNEEQKMETLYKMIKDTLIKEMKVPEEKASEVILELRKMNMDELSQYLEVNYNFYNVKNNMLSYLKHLKYHQGSMEEVNGYIKERLEEHPFSYYFSRKFADFGGLFMAFFSTILLSFLFLRDTKKDTYELLHTKPISSWKYILGKISGGFLMALFTLSLLNIIFITLCTIYGRKAGFPVRIIDLPIATLLYVLPNMLMIICVYAITAFIFKNPLPAIPFLFLYIIYSNMGSRNAEGDYGYFGRPLSIMVRFPDNFFETNPPPMALFNQPFLILASIVLTLFSIYIWKRRRVY